MPFSSHDGYKLNSHLTCFQRGFIAQSVKHRTGIAEVMGSNSVGASGFFLGFICNVGVAVVVVVVVVVSISVIFSVSVCLSLSISASVCHCPWRIHASHLPPCQCKLATISFSVLAFVLTENESPLFAGHLKLIKTLFTCEGVDKRTYGESRDFFINTKRGSALFTLKRCRRCWFWYFKGAVSATPLFLFTSGDAIN